MFKKILSVLLIINLMICTTMILPIQFVTALENENVQSTDGNDSALISALTVYFNSRTMTTADAITASLCEITNSGIPEDEIKRMNLWKNQGIISITNSYSIDYLEASDILGVAYVTESISYSYTDNIENQYVTHYIEFLYNEDGSAHILMDSYAEPLINFESCSYLPDYLLSLADNTIGNETATNDHVNTGDYAYDVAQIALTQVGYLEKATKSQLDHKTANAGTGNYTKYARDIGDNFSMAWCAAFVSWCAQEAGLEIGDREGHGLYYQGTVIPDEPSCHYMQRYFNNLGVYYSRSSYTPKIGDIFFMYDEEDDAWSHVGLVVSVTSTQVEVVHGNFSNQVKHTTYSLTGTAIAGYASPIYPTSVFDHNYVCTDSTHEDSTTHVCSYCGNEAVGTLECAHSGTITQSCDLCDYSRVVTWGNHNDSNMIHSCPFCDVTQTAYWNCSHDGEFTRSCTLCDVIRPGIWTHIDDNYTIHYCSVCDETATGTWHGDHTGTPEHTCTLCGYESQTLMADPVYDHDDTYHWYKCQICNDTWNYQTHSCEMTNGGHICIVCERFWPFGVMDIPNQQEIK